MKLCDHILEDFELFRNNLHSLLRKDDAPALNYVAEMKMVKYPGKIESLGGFSSLNEYKMYLEQKEKRGGNTLIKKDNNKTMLFPSKQTHHVIQIKFKYFF